METGCGCLVKENRIQRYELFLRVSSEVTGGRVPSWVLGSPCHTTAMNGARRIQALWMEGWVPRKVLVLLGNRAKSRPQPSRFSNMKTAYHGSDATCLRFIHEGTGAKSRMLPSINAKMKRKC